MQKIWSSERFVDLKLNVINNCALDTLNDIHISGKYLGFSLKIEPFIIPSLKAFIHCNVDSATSHSTMICNIVCPSC